jgi:hypothetical protein
VGIYVGDSVASGCIVESWMETHGRSPNIRVSNDNAEWTELQGVKPLMVPPHIGVAAAWELPADRSWRYLKLTYGPEDVACTDVRIKDAIRVYSK